MWKLTMVDGFNPSVYGTLITFDEATVISVERDFEFDIWSRLV